MKQLSQSTSSHLYAVAGMSNQLYRSWRNQDELKEIKSAQKAGFLKPFPGLLQSFLILFNDMATQRDRPPNEPSIPDPRIEQTDDQALGRYIHLGAIYIGNKIELSS